MGEQQVDSHATVPGGRYTSHVGESLAETDRKLAVYELQRERTELYLAIHEAVSHDAKRSILSTVYFNDGVVDYATLDEWVNRHISNIKKHVGSLDGTEIIERSGNPAVISFTDSDVSLLVEDVLNLTE